MSEQLEPLATEAGQQAIVRAINNLSSLEYAVRAEHAATAAAQSADDALTSATNASNSETKARDWAEKTNGAVETETIVTPPETEGDPPTEELVSYFSAKYWAQMAEDYFSQMTFDTVPTEDSTNGITSGAVYDALATKQDTLTFDNAPTQNSVNPVKSGGVYSALDTKADKSTTYTKTEVDTALSNVQGQLTFDSTPTANSTNPVTSGGVYTALQNVNIDIDDEITEDSDNPVTSAAIYEALQNFTPSGGGSGGVGNASGMTIDFLYKNDNGVTGVNTQIELTKSWKDYDILVYITASSTSEGISGNNPNLKSRFILVDRIKMNPEFSYGHDAGRFMSLKFITDTSAKFTFSNGEYLYEIIGIKFSKNLSEQMCSNVLYENSSGTTTGNITLNDSYKNYDLFAFNVAITSESPTSNSPIMNPILATRQQLEDSTIGKFSVSGWGSRSTHFIIVNDTTLNCTLTEGDQRVYKIIGYKMAKGGYSGIVSDARMTVKSGFVDLSSGVTKRVRQDYNVTFDSLMPDTNYIVNTHLVQFADYYNSLELTITNKTINGFTITGWLQADNNIPATQGFGIDWIAIRPNSYTREGMVEDILWSNDSFASTQSNNSPISQSNGTINLSGNISDYDLIQITSKYTTNIDGTDYMNKCIRIITSSEIENQTTSVFADSTVPNSSTTRFYQLGYVNDNTLWLRKKIDLIPCKITGIKFGRYVGGVAVDTTVTQNSNAVVTSGAVYDALQNIPTGTGDVTTNTDQNITGTKTFVGSKKVAFKQSTTNDKLGFTLYGNTGTERGYLEFNPTNTVDGVTGLMTLGNYATSAAALTQVGFRRYSNISGASGAYNLLMPMIADARTPFNLTTTYTNFYLPLGFTDGTTTVTTAKSGVVDLSPLLQAAINSITNANGVSY